MVSTKCLIIQAHPDDELVCFPSFLKCDILCLSTCNGRIDILRNLANELNFKLFTEPFQALRFHLQQDQILSKIESIASKYDTIITHHPNDLHQDHQTIFQIVKRLLRFSKSKTLISCPSIQHDWLNSFFTGVKAITYRSLIEKYFTFYETYFNISKIYRQRFKSISKFYASLYNSQLPCWPLTIHNTYLP